MFFWHSVFSYHIPLHDVAVKLHSLSVDFWLFVLLPCKPFYVESLKFSQPWDLYSLRKELWPKCWAECMMWIRSGTSDLLMGSWNLQTHKEFSVHQKGVLTSSSTFCQASEKTQWFSADHRGFRVRSPEVRDAFWQLDYERFPVPSRWMSQMLEERSLGHSADLGNVQGQCAGLQLAFHEDQL